MPRKTPNEVDAWLSAYDNPMKPVVMRIREIMLAADPRLGERIKWQAPTFTYKGNLASFFPRARQFASLMFHTGAEIPGHHPRLEGSGATGRSLKLATVAEANAAARDLRALVTAWCDWKDGTAVAQRQSAARKRPAAKAQPARPTRKKKTR